MALTQRLELRQGQALVMTPQLQPAIKLLQMSNLELSQFVEQELEKNPLLERDEAKAREDNSKEEAIAGADGALTLREDAPPAPLSSYQRHAVPHAKVRDWITLNLRTAGPLAPTLAKRLRETMLDFDLGREPDVTVTHVFHLAPISPASDDLWVFHENKKQFLLFSSDMDLSNEAYWESTPITLEVYNLAPEVILAADASAAGTNTLSKDFVGRALFNCVVLGERIEVSPERAKQLLEEKKQRSK